MALSRVYGRVSDRGIRESDRTLATHLDENDGLADGHQAVKLAENIVFDVIIGAVNEHLGDALDSELATLQLEAVSVRCKLASIFHDILRECGRKEENLDVLGQHATHLVSTRVGSRILKQNLLLDSQALIAKSLLIQHVVGLIQYKDLKLRDIQLSAPDDVHDRTRGSNDDTSSDWFATG